MAFRSQAIIGTGASLPSVHVHVCLEGWSVKVLEGVKMKVVMTVVKRIVSGGHISRHTHRSSPRCRIWSRNGSLLPLGNLGPVKVMRG